MSGNEFWAGRAPRIAVATLGALLALVALVALLALALVGWGSHSFVSSIRSTTGTAEECPNRNAYCPVDGPGVSRPGAPATSPSQRFRLEVLPAQPRTTGEDWTFRVVDVASGTTVLQPAHPWFDGGLGLVIAWGPTQPDTVWVTSGVRALRWRYDESTNTWTASAA